MDVMGREGRGWDSSWFRSTGFFDLRLWGEEKRECCCVGIDCVIFFLEEGKEGWGGRGKMMMGC